MTAKDYLAEVSAGTILVPTPEGIYSLNNIHSAIAEWIEEGWHVSWEPTIPMVAAAIFNEATLQDECVKAGESHKAYPHALRYLAYKLLSIDGHLPNYLPVL